MLGRTWAYERTKGARKSLDVPPRYPQRSCPGFSRPHNRGATPPNPRPPPPRVPMNRAHPGPGSERCPRLSLCFPEPRPGRAFGLPRSGSSPARSGPSSCLSLASWPRRCRGVCRLFCGASLRLGLRRGFLRLQQLRCLGGKNPLHVLSDQTHHHLAGKCPPRCQGPLLNSRTSSDRETANDLHLFGNEPTKCSF